MKVPLHQLLPVVHEWLEVVIAREELSPFSRFSGIPYTWLHQVYSGAIVNPRLDSLIRLVEGARRWDAYHGRDCPL